MSKKTIISISIIVGLILLSVVFASSRNEGKDVTLDTKPKVMEDGTLAVTGTYEEYAPEKIIHASSTNVVLFFKASWCPTCKTLDTDIKNNLGNIPADLKILQVDYDTSSALKRKYSVTYQHTIVQVDTDGIMIKKWSGSSNLVALINQIQ